MDRIARGARIVNDLSVRRGGARAKDENAIGKQRQNFVLKDTLQFRAALAGWQRQHAGEKFAQTDGRQKKRLGRLSIQPTQYRGIGARPPCSAAPSAH